MIVTENLVINNIPFTRTYSDSGYLIEREGIQYSEAVDPSEFNRVYTETDILIEGDEEITDDELIAMLEEVL